MVACGASITPMQPRRGGIFGTVKGPLPTESSYSMTLSDLEYFENSPLMVPVVGVEAQKVPNTFFEARSGDRVHRATDILAPIGTPIVAAAAGKILRLSDNPLGGITIYMLDPDARFLYYYAHLDRYVDGLQTGQTVRQGDILGYVGKTGNASVPHLHFQTMRWDPKRRDYWNGVPLDVRGYFRLTGKERSTN